MWVSAVVAALIAVVPPAFAQDGMTAAERLKAMSDPDSVLDGTDKKKKEKEKPPFEFFRTQVAPFDILPYIKANHWFTMTMEMQANLFDYDGILQTASEVSGRPQIKLLNMPHAMVYRRAARLKKGQRSALGLQMMLPEFGKELILELTRPDAIRAEGGWQASLMRLEAHQWLIPVLSPDPTPYSAWSRWQATIPTAADRTQGASFELDRQRYYRMVLPQEPGRPPLSPHSLTWTTISHIVWDSLPPESLTPYQQQALVDWLHWGGQLIVVAAGPSALAPLEESFLAPYLPARASGKNASLTEADFAAMSAEFRPVLWPEEIDEPLDFESQKQAQGKPQAPRYKDPDSILPDANRPVFLIGLEPKPGAESIPLGDAGGHLMGAEWRVGRGRLLMLAFNPNDPAIAKWTGSDTFVRRVILRRPEEPRAAGNERTAYGMLSGPELTWVRFLGRDLGARDPGVDPNAAQQGDAPMPNAPVAAWLDTAADWPVRSKTALELASGITIPGSPFVLKVILAYIVALVPLNWLICRFLLRKREVAWIVVPVLALGFAVAVERAAAYDLGFDSACDEIDLVELQPGYRRAHVNRFAALYSTGRDQYQIAFDDSTALALPLNNQRSLRGEETALSVFQSPEPALSNFAVQPRSLSMFRAEAISDLPGGIDLVGDLSTGQIVNNSGLELRDAVLIDVDATAREQYAWEQVKKAGEAAEPPVDPASLPARPTIGRRLGTIAAGSTINLSKADGASASKTAPAESWLKKEPFLERLQSYAWGRAEDAGEVRLVAWTPGPHPGERITPAVDRHRGVRFVVVHLKYAPPPVPSAGTNYYSPPR